MILSIDTQAAPIYELRLMLDALNDILAQRENSEPDDEDTSEFSLPPMDDEFESDEEDGMPTVHPCMLSPETHDHQGHYQSQVPPPPPAAQPTTITVFPPPTSNPQVIATISQGSAQSVTDEELDSDGKPWDATIHSETRAKNKDGTWRNRRNRKNVEVKTAIPGLEAITPHSVPAPPRERPMVRTFVRINGAQDIIAAPEGATDEELTAITGKPTMREVAEPTTPAIPPPPPAAPPVIKTAPQGSPVGTFAELMERVTKHFGAQRITSKDLAEICTTFGIGSIQECFTLQSLIPLVGKAIDAKANAKGDA